MAVASDFRRVPVTDFRIASLPMLRPTQRVVTQFGVGTRTPAAWLAAATTRTENHVAADFTGHDSPLP